MAFKVTDRSYFAIVKKQIHALAVAGSFSESRVGEIDIIVSEMVSNLVKHAGGGQVLVKMVTDDPNGPAMELISMDDGPGMMDVTRMVADGVSTKNTLGHGLGSMKRLADIFQIYSQKDWGTLILARVYKEPLPHFIKPPTVEIRSLLVPKPGEEECGDGFFHTTQQEYIKLFLGDGLGHGPEAAKAVTMAGQAFLECEETDPVAIIRHINISVKKTRGLVGTAAIFDTRERRWKICGVGNISTRVNSVSGIKSYMAYNGIIGLNVPNTLNAQEIPYEKGQQLIMCSDGLKTRWDPVRFTGIGRYDLTLLAGCLLKDFARYTDDMSAAVCKINN